MHAGSLLSSYSSDKTIMIREYNYIMQPLIHFIWCNNLMKNKLNIEADYIRGSWNLREKYHRPIYKALVSVCGDNTLRNFILKEESQIGQWDLWSLLIPFLLDGMKQNDKIRNHLITFLCLFRMGFIYNELTYLCRLIVWNRRANS